VAGRYLQYECLKFAGYPAIGVLSVKCANATAVLHLRRSKDIGPGTEYISEYEELIAGIEQEVHYYLTVSARQSA
jgi:hypothetical protein